ncbi:hypothetical protein H4219_001377 [Mycoemilia scoparia]|uniref:Uncharacterized protein n=1 Tax=Mycoemilia scoparia TaxID=417184 RepID=A0A9W8A6X0_9FUNG|nr:hypothetical protein H4219_001377 [Mycoemilia scoparia]
MTLTVLRQLPVLQESLVLHKISGVKLNNQIPSSINPTPKEGDLYIHKDGAVHERPDDDDDDDNENEDYDMESLGLEFDFIFPDSQSLDGICAVIGENITKHVGEIDPDQEDSDDNDQNSENMTGITRLNGTSDLKKSGFFTEPVDPQQLSEDGRRTMERLNETISENNTNSNASGNTDGHNEDEEDRFEDAP